MPKFAANLSMMFTEVPFLDRFAAASDAGFSAVEFLFPYEHLPEVVERVSKAAGVEVILFNMPAGNWSAGERGIARSDAAWSARRGDRQFAFDAGRGADFRCQFASSSDWRDHRLLSHDSTRQPAAHGRYGRTFDPHRLRFFRFGFPAGGTVSDFRLRRQCRFRPLGANDATASDLFRFDTVQHSGRVCNTDTYHRHDHDSVPKLLRHANGGISLEGRNDVRR